MTRLESIDYNYVSDRVLDVAIKPYNYIVHEVPLSHKLLSLFFALFVFGILLPVTETAVRWIRALCHPITFPYKHVVITGCGTGLGKALV